MSRADRCRPRPNRVHRLFNDRAAGTPAARWATRPVGQCPWDSATSSRPLASRFARPSSPFAAPDLHEAPIMTTAWTFEGSFELDITERGTEVHVDLIGDLD